MAKAMMSMKDWKGGTCPCPHHKVMPMASGLLVLLGGVLLLLKNMGNIAAGTADLWIAIFVILFGLGWISKGLCKCCTWK